MLVQKGEYYKYFKYRESNKIFNNLEMRVKWLAGRKRVSGAAARTGSYNSKEK